MTPIKTTLLIIATTLFGAAAGGAAGFYAAVTTPAVSNVAVLDVERLTRGISSSDPQLSDKAQRLAQKARAVTQRLTAAGMVVLDRASVIDAPEHSIIHVDSQE